MTAKKPKPTTAKADYELTPEERKALGKHLARKAAAAPAPGLKVSDQAAKAVSVDHPDKAVGQALLMEALGTTDQDFFVGLLGEVANAGVQGRQIDEPGLNFMLAIVKGIGPRDQIEAMLAAQMAAVHVATMTFARRLANVENIPQQDSAERAFNKLARTFATQMEVLKRYRTGGEQKVTVQHVSVSEGGQAIVGNVTQATRETKPGNAPPPALPDVREAPMPILDRVPSSVPLKRRSTK